MLKIGERVFFFTGVSTFFRPHLTMQYGSAPGDQDNIKCFIYTYMYGTYRVILGIVKAGCHPVAIAQVVDH